MKRRIGQAILLWHTVRHLKPIQIGGRAWFRLHRPKPELAPAPPPRAATGAWTAPARRPASQVGPQRFRFLNREGDLSGGWDDERHEKLWRYNLHYFDDLNALDADDRRAWHDALIRRWVAENPPAGGSGWEPYPTSLRIVNWIKWSLAGHPLPPDALRSLAIQARWLARRLEYHLLGNHLFANAKALVFAGCFFEGEEARRWSKTGWRILGREVAEQILADGGHFERSTMYHALALEDLLDLVNLSRAFPGAPGHHAALAETLARTIAPMRGWLAAMCHPDGEIAFFNDAAIGIAPAPAELCAYADRMHLAAGPPLSGLLGPSGYARLEVGPGVVVLDAAPIGPDYLPGHAHADTLSFELSLDGRRLLVNSGTSVYGAGPERLRQRGTAAHNTVVVAGENSSEVWSGFRVARRARPFGLAIVEEGDTLRASCAHDGYTRLSGRPVHRRVVELAPGGLVVDDRVSGGDHPAEARFHFHPDWTVTASAGGGGGTARSPDGRAATWSVAAGQGRLEAASYHPEFGRTVPTICLAVTLAAGQSRVQFRW